ncbi:hypothetical protein [Streptomyces longispororuber]|uniref:hypothetical protein n=1 Tax=Streptomyces longispororuber TaxID=68230 RepID=UPI003700F20D
MALLTLDEAKRQLDIETTAHDVELQLYLEALAPVIEGYIGPVENRIVTETLTSHGASLCLRQTPVVSLTSLTPVLDGGAALDVATLAVDTVTGVITRRDRFLFCPGPWTAVYVAGRGTVPATVKLAAAILLQHLWRTQYGAARGAVGGGDDYAVTEPVAGFGYAVPNRVLELLEPYKMPPAVA